MRGCAALRLAAGLEISLAVAGGLLCAAPAALAQGSDTTAQKRFGSGETSSPSILKPSQPPAFQIAVEPLGFSAPGAAYLGQRITQVSLGFLDESRLLFTFRVPGLIRREARSGEAGNGEASNGEASEQRQIRALVLDLPSGRVEAEALWTLHDRARYLWMLKDGSFLLRDGKDLKKGDATLELKPFLRFPGPLLWLDTDPMQQVLATGSQEPVAQERGKPAGGAEDGARTAGQADLVVRILRRDSGQVLLVSRAGTAAHLPINSDGYLESLRSRGIEWQLNLHAFTGAITPVGRLDSSCAPSYDFVSQRELVATACNAKGGHKLVAMASDGRRLWEAQLPEIDVWPLLAPSPDGSRLMRETLAVSRGVNASSPLTTEDVRGQSVEIFDAANGKVVLAVPVTPALDGGGNVAISPSGRRVAVLNGGFIQIFELPAPDSPPDHSGKQSSN
jgi:hypothetical protein